MIKEEKQNTELRAEELESRVNNLDMNDEDNGVVHLSQAYAKQHQQQQQQQQQQQAATSPINSGRSTPSQTKSDLFKLALNKNKDTFKSMTVV
jgi:hypothetical protein